MTEYNGLKAVHNVMNGLDPNSSEYEEALEVLGDPGSEAAKQFCLRHRIAPLTPKPSPEDLTSYRY